MANLDAAVRTLASRVEDEAFAQRLYAALCNTDWTHDDGTETGYTWRGAGAVVAEMRGNTSAWNYMDWYCSGDEGTIAPDAAEALAELGWHGKEME